MPSNDAFGPIFIRSGPFCDRRHRIEAKKFSNLLKRWLVFLPILPKHLLSAIKPIQKRESAVKLSKLVSIVPRPRTSDYLKFSLGMKKPNAFRNTEVKR
jgi:hypothetical protein